MEVFIQFLKEVLECAVYLTLWKQSDCFIMSISNFKEVSASQAIDEFWEWHVHRPQME